MAETCKCEYKYLPLLSMINRKVPIGTVAALKRLWEIIFFQTCECLNIKAAWSQISGEGCEETGRCLGSAAAAASVALCLR